jgi:aryl-alcohol dehydrogenase-like predicted oxidoreductase
MYDRTEQQDEKVLQVVKQIAEAHGVPRGHVALAWLLSKPVITAPIVGATKAQHLAEAIDSLNFNLSEEEIKALEESYVPHPVEGVIPPLPADPPAISAPR